MLYNHLHFSLFLLLFFMVFPTNTAKSPKLFGIFTPALPLFVIFNNNHLTFLYISLRSIFFFEKVRFL